MSTPLCGIWNQTQSKLEESIQSIKYSHQRDGVSSLLPKITLTKFCSARSMLPAPSPWSALVASRKMWWDRSRRVAAGRKERKQVLVASWWFGWKYSKSWRAGCCLILMRCGSAPLVHLLTQSSHWVTATAHYRVLFWPELAESC